jgi:hypothetical protein
MSGGKKIIWIAAAVILASAAAFLVWRLWFSGVPNGASFRAEGSGFQILRNGQWQEFPIKGVNLGAGKPGYFPGEMAVTKEEYARWFQQIADMNSNSIRVYTILSPGFYEALYEHNRSTDKPLYLFHGAWINEEDILEHMDLYAPAIADEFKAEIERLIDVLHGNARLPERTGHASGRYRWDVSSYMAGYILGIELDADTVISTNRHNAHITSYDGEYLYTENATPHECWLAQMADHAISYEQRRYKTQKPMSWVNWLTTDPMTHSNEPDAEKEDAIGVDTEHILTKEAFTAGLFASYHVYPYYPEFMIFQPEYREYIDENGEQNPYKAYLLELKAHHSVPLLVAEFGIPSSRGGTHPQPDTGFSQGHVTEHQQGEYVAHMYRSIVSAGIAGGLVFSWQDEWFKRSWNTMDYDIPDRRAYWSNGQVSEQHYGLMSFDLGKDRMICHADGDPSEWRKRDAVSQANGLTLSAMSDARYLYLMIRDDRGDIGSRRYVIGMDSVAGQGNLRFDDMGISFQNEADIVIVLDGRDNTAVMIDAYYDMFYRLYSLTENIPRDERFEVRNSGIFNPIRLMLSSELHFPLTGEILPVRYYDTGRLLHGSSNPESPDYNSLADFHFTSDGTGAELRIPWQLLNVADPSSKTVAGDLYASGRFDINPVKTEGFALELYALEDGGALDGGTGRYNWDGWNMIAYHERLKPSYDIIRDAFGE